MLRYKIAATVLAGYMYTQAAAQELFVYSEPASNMAARSIGVRASNWMMNEQQSARINYHFIPELMVGVNKHLMLHAEGFFSNRTASFAAEGGAVYAKYRFYSNDDVYRHFRMAAFTRLAVNNADIHQEEIDINGHNTGFDLGIIATQLLHKTAISATVYSRNAFDNLSGNEFPAAQQRHAVSYSLSAGRLILPRVYTSYKQVNLNLMLELLGQMLPGENQQFVDIAPSAQLIVNSQTRIDVGYKMELYSNMRRTAPSGLLLRVEHVLFNVL